MAGNTLITEIIDFSGGMTNNARTPALNVSRIQKGFDDYSVEGMLKPYRDMRVDAITESTLDAFRIKKFDLVNGNLYGVGQVGAADFHTQVYKKSIAGDPTSAWTTASSGTDINSIETGIAASGYHNYLYGVNTAGVWKYGDVSGSPSFTYNEYQTHVPTGQPIVHSKDDIQYWPAGNLILANNAGSWQVGLTLPSLFSISDIAEDGSYLDIAGNMPDGTSIVYQWDRDTSLTTLSVKMDWGKGQLKLIGLAGGTLVGISLIGNSSTSINSKIVFKYWNGRRAITFGEIDADMSSEILILKCKQQFNDLFYFLAEIQVGNQILNGLWRIFQKPNGSFTFAFDIAPRNDTDLGSQALNGFYRWGDYIFISYINPVGGGYTVWRTDDQLEFTGTSIWQTRIINEILGLRNKRVPDSSATKQLVRATLMVSPLQAGQSATVQYRVDGSEEWIPIFTMSDDGDISHTAVNCESLSGDEALFPEHKELEFSLESTGGAEIIGFKCTTEFVDKDI